MERNVRSSLLSLLTATATTLLLATATANAFTQRVCPGKPADLVVVMDESSSIWPVHFRKQREFLTNLTDGFEISPDKTRVAVVSFADDYTLRFNLDTYGSNDEVKAAVGRISQKTGGTRTDLALEYVGSVSVLGRARNDVPRIVILVTDGASWYPDRTKKQAEMLRRQNVTIIAVAISNQINWDEINAIATKPLEKHAFSVTSFEGLGQQLVSDLVDTTCEIKSEQPPAVMPHSEPDPEAKPEPPGMPTIRIYSERTVKISTDRSDGTVQWLQPETAKAGDEPTRPERPRYAGLQGRHGTFTVFDKPSVVASSDLGNSSGDSSSRSDGSLIGSNADSGASVSGRPGHRASSSVSVGQNRVLPASSISVSASWSSSSDGANTIEIIPIPAGHHRQSSVGGDGALPRINPHRSELQTLRRVIVHDRLTASRLHVCGTPRKIDVALVLGSLYQNPRSGYAAMMLVEGFVRELAASQLQQRGSTQLDSNNVRVAVVPQGCVPDSGGSFGWNGLSSPQALVREAAQRRSKLPQAAEHLDYVRERIFSDEPSSREPKADRLVILILDRVPADAASTQRAVRRLQERGATVAIVVVGHSTESVEYARYLVRDDRLVFSVAGYSPSEATILYMRSLVCQ